MNRKLDKTLKQHLADRLIVKKIISCGSSALCEYCNKPCKEYKHWLREYNKNE